MKRMLFRWIGRIRAIRAHYQQSEHFSFMGAQINVQSGVINPSFISVSRIFARQAVSSIPHGAQSALELGCGCGLAAILLAQKGLEVFAVDIDANAVANTRANAHLNQVALKTQHSDWDAALPAHLQFDYIISNPPFLETQGNLPFSADAGLSILNACFACVKRRLNVSGNALLTSSSWSGRARVLGLLQANKLKILHSKRTFLGNEWIYTDLCQVEPCA